MLNIYASNEISEENMFTKEEYTDINCPAHSHFSIEIIIVKDGSLVVEINNTEYTLNEKEIILIMPFEMHKFITPKHSNTIVLSITPHVFPEYKSIFENKTPKNPKVHITCSELDSILQHIKLIDNNNIIDIKCVFYMLFSAFINNCEFINAPMPGEVFRKAIIYINTHPSTNITLKALAKELHVSYVYLSRVFNKNTSSGFSSFLNSFRLDNSIRLLKNSNKTIGEIAYECGFGSIRNFNRVFKSEILCTPKEFRDNIGNKNEWKYYNNPYIVEFENNSRKIVKNSLS